MYAHRNSKHIAALCLTQKLGLVLGLALATLYVACSPAAGGALKDESGGGSGDPLMMGQSGPSGTAGSGLISAGDSSLYNDFPARAILDDPSLPASLPRLFQTHPSGSAQPSGNPCLTEPPAGAMIPKNWSPLFLQWSSPTSATQVFELRLHAETQNHDLLVYTKKSSYSIPKDIWFPFASHSGGTQITITLRAATLVDDTLQSSPVLGIEEAITLAPVQAKGTVVYWTTSNGSALKGFTIGDTTASLVATPQRMADGTQCLGCHTSSPDGKLAFLSRSNVAGGEASIGTFSIDARTLDGALAKAPSTSVTPYALSLLARPDQTAPVFSPTHYTPTDSVVVSVLRDASTSNRYELIWTDLLATTGGSGILARTGDAHQAANPSFSHDGTTIVYTSTDGVEDGRSTNLPTDVYRVPFNNRSGGAATPLVGASDANANEYYPVYSPNDALIAFNRTTEQLTYDQPKSEIYVVSAQGGQATRLVGNDPAACSGVASPGVTNSWPRWSPNALTWGGKRYYWVVFSSTRRNNIPQLFISALVTSTTQRGSTEVLEQSYPAVYVTAQSETESNHTPAWDNFLLPTLLK